MDVCICVCLFVCVYMSGWVSDPTSLGTSQALQGMEAYLPPPLPLPVADALRHRCVGGSVCPGVGAQVHTGSLLGGCLSGPGAWGSLGPLRRRGALGLSAWGSVTLAQLAAGGAHGHVTATPPPASASVFFVCLFCWFLFFALLPRPSSQLFFFPSFFLPFSFHQSSLSRIQQVKIK